MAAISAATVLAITKAASPVISDLYKSAKGNVRNSLKKWEAQQFPKRLAKKLVGFRWLGLFGALTTTYHFYNFIILPKSHR